MTRSRAAAWLVTIALGTGLAGCADGDSSTATPAPTPSATSTPSDTSTPSSAAMCAARDDLAASVDGTVDAARDGDVRAVRAGITEVRAGAEALRTAVGTLADEQRTALQPQVDRVDAAWQAVRDARRPSELGTAVATLGEEVDALTDAVTAALDCDA